MFDGFSASNSITKGKDTLDIGYQFGLGLVVPLNNYVHFAFSLKHLDRGRGSSKGIQEIITPGNEVRLRNIVVQKHNFKSTQILASIRVNLQNDKNKP